MSKQQTPVDDSFIRSSQSEKLRAMSDISMKTSKQQLKIITDNSQKGVTPKRDILDMSKKHRTSTNRDSSPSEQTAVRITTRVPAVSDRLSSANFQREQSREHVDESTNAFVQRKKRIKRKILNDYDLTNDFFSPSFLLRTKMRQFYYKNDDYPSSDDFVIRNHREISQPVVRTRIRKTLKVKANSHNHLQLIR
ncbi:unnamed protein product [Didymodactylos carnosus]|nr:unnamed protein product [Didymodactylos carnosus]CAF3781268.1 unnamed protein product [Didymodactylos carnosus]